MFFVFFSYTDPTFTHTNLTQLLDSLDSNLWVINDYLNIPQSEDQIIKAKHSDEAQRKKALCRWYLDNHPAPSWKHVADALYRYGDHVVLDVLQSQYLKGGFSALCGLLDFNGLQCVLGYPNLGYPYSRLSELRDCSLSE